MNKNVNNQYIKKDQKIIHIGLGAFHRAHQALYTSELLDNKKSNWTICSINLFGSQSLIQQLREQGHCYAVLERGATSEQIKISKAITQSLHPDLDGQSTIIEKIANPNVRIVSMTITEKGYCIEPSTGSLDVNNRLIQLDLDSPSRPVSAIGYIVEGLRLRKERNINAFTVLSCDNIQNNGEVAKSAILSFAKLVDLELYSWIEANVTFPNTMVDRIVPAASKESLSYIETAIGYSDPCSIACEPFRQWVIEDNFVIGRPNWDEVGAQFVDDVIPFEEMKLRMLNGSHSLLAYLGYLSGYKYVSEAISDPYFKKVILDFMMNEQTPSLSLPKETDIAAYADSLIERFSNPNLKHLTSQIAMDGSQKLPPRFCESLKYNRENAVQTTWLELGIAGWMAYVIGMDDNGDAIEVHDPMAGVFKQIKQESKTPREAVISLLSIDGIFESSLLADAEFVNKIVDLFECIQEVGAMQTLHNLTKTLNLKG